MNKKMEWETIGFLQVNLGGRSLSHDLLMRWLATATKPVIVCVQEPFLSRKGFCQLPKEYACFWSTNNPRNNNTKHNLGIERRAIAQQTWRLPTGAFNSTETEGNHKTTSSGNHWGNDANSARDARMKERIVSKNKRDIIDTEDIWRKGVVTSSEVKKRRRTDYWKGSNNLSCVGIEPGTNANDCTQTPNRLCQQKQCIRNMKEVVSEDDRYINVDSIKGINYDGKRKRKLDMCLEDKKDEVEARLSVQVTKKRRKYELCSKKRNRRNRRMGRNGVRRKLKDNRGIEPGVNSDENPYMSDKPLQQNIIDNTSYLNVRYESKLLKKKRLRKEASNCVNKYRITGKEAKMKIRYKNNHKVKISDCNEERDEKESQTKLKIVKKKSCRIRSIVIAPRKMKGYMVSQFSNSDCVIVRFECLKISVISLYCDINCDIESSWLFVNRKHMVYKNLVICADTNAHCIRWGSSGNRSNRHRSYKRGDMISEILDELDLVVCNVIPHLPTYVGDFGYSTFIDATFCSSTVCNKIRKWKVSIECFESDHKSIFFEYKAGKEILHDVMDNEGSHGIPWLRPSDNMTRMLEESLPKLVKFQRRICSNSDVDLFVQKHSMEVQEALKKIFKRKTSRAYAPCYWWTKEVSTFHRQLKIAKRRMIRYKYRNLVEEYNACRSRFRAKVKEAKVASWRDFTSNITDPWKGLMKILKRKDVNKSNDRTLCFLEGDYAEDIGSTLRLLSEQFYPKSKEFTNEQLRIERNVSNMLISVKKGEDITLCEFRKALGEMKRATAPGRDLITNSVLHILVEKGRFEKIYVKMFNVCLKFGYFPDDWKQAKIVLIPKSADLLNSVKAMRPISLTSVFSKLLERIVLARILHFIELSGKLAVSQHAYRKGGSTTTAVYEVAKFIQDALYDKNVCVAVFLDISGAFDTTWHGSILYRLLQYGVLGYLVKWVKSFLFSRSAQFSAAGAEYNVNLEQGCPQGGVLSPVLWNILFNDLLTMKTKSDQNFHLKIVGYADDAALLCRAKNVKNASDILTNHLVKVKKWADENRVQFNQKKLNVLVFSKGSKMLPSSVFFDGMLINEVTQYKYLGLIFDGKLSWRPHINNLIDKLSKVTRMLRCAVRENWGVRMNIMRMLFKAIFCPILLYGVAIWGGKATGKNMCGKLDSAMRKFCIMSTRCFRSTSNDVLFRIMKTSKFSCLVKQEVLRVALLQLKLAKGQKDHIFSREHMIERISPTSMEHFFFICKQGLDTRSINVVYDNLLHFYSVHPAEWVSTNICIRERVTAIWDGVNKMGWIIYTDASVSSYGAGCAYVVFHHGFCVKAQGYSLTQCSIFTAETKAILHAIRYIRNIEDLNEKEIVEIRGDSQAVIRALAKTIVTDPVLKEVKDELRLAKSQGVNILLRWVPSHSGLEGNEIADRYAKEAVDSVVSRNTCWTERDLRSWVKKLVSIQLKNEWERYNAKIPKLFFPSVDMFESFLKSSPSAELCQLVSGHCRLNDFLCNKLSVITSPMCACNEEIETIPHFLFECTCYEHIRREIWGESKLTFELMRRDWKKVDEYIRKTKRFENKSYDLS